MHCRVEIRQFFIGIAGVTLILAGSLANAQTKKPNILVIFGDDIGQANISRYTHGVVGYMTPNIDRLSPASRRYARV
jgi:hypothetical protein